MDLNINLNGEIGFEKGGPGSGPQPGGVRNNGGIKVGQLVRSKGSVGMPTHLVQRAATNLPDGKTRFNLKSVSPDHQNVTMIEQSHLNDKYEAPMKSSGGNSPYNGVGKNGGTFF